MSHFKKALTIISSAAVLSSLSACAEEKPHDHNFIDGFCEICGEACDHDYDRNTCEICGYKRDPHYDYKPHLSALPSIRIGCEDGDHSWLTAATPFDPNNPATKDRPYHKAVIQVSDCDEEFALTAQADVKIRGNYTATYPKKPLRIKFEKKQGMLGLNGGQKYKNWVLLADYKDGSMQRNSTAFYLSKMLLGSDGYYSTDFKQVNVYVDGEYWGIYLLAEQQEVKGGRVDLTEPDEGFPDTNIGYFMEYDGYYKLEKEEERFECAYYNNAPLKMESGGTIRPSMNGFSLKNDVYKTSEDYCAQNAFIKNYMNLLYELCYKAVYEGEYMQFNPYYTQLMEYQPKTENAVRETVEKVIDIRSLVDVYILNEICCDADIAWSSFLMDVDFGENGDKLLRFEAPWDFDSSLGLKECCKDGRGLFAANTGNPWLLIFANQEWFKEEVKVKWSEFYREGAQLASIDYIYKLNNYYQDGYMNNVDRWGFHKNSEWNDEAMKCNNQQEMSGQFVSWLSKRYNYLNSIWL